MYLDNEHKTVVALNKRVPLWKALNAGTHTTLALGQLCGRALDLKDYETADNQLTQISRFPAILMRGRGKDLKELYACAQKAPANGEKEWLATAFFLDCMFGESLEQQQTATAAQNSNDAEFVCVAVFGRSVNVDQLTRRLSLVGADWS